MRTNIVIDDQLMEAAMRGGLYKTKKDAVEAGLKLVARQAAYRDILRWEGQLTSWEDPAATPGVAPTLPHLASEPTPTSTPTSGQAS